MDVIFDIDGTIANISHRMHFIASKPKNWGEFFRNMEKDEPILHMIDLVRRIGLHGTAVTVPCRIIWCTGRPEKYRRITQIWLANNHVPCQNLYMRPDRDNRQDYIVKEEALTQMRKDGFNPVIAFEDRTQVVDSVQIPSENEGFKKVLFYP